MSVQESLRHLNAFSHFSLDQFEVLAKAAEVLAMPENHRVVRRGDATGNLFGLTRGSLAIQRQTPHGDFVLARLKAGELVGEVSFVEQQIRSTDVITTSQSEFISLDASKLRAMADEDRRFELALYWALWGSISKKLRITTRMLSHFFSSNEPGEGRTSVGRPADGEPIAVDIHTKRDLFLSNDLSHMEANFLASLSKAERFEAGETIFREGSSGDTLYFVLDGEVRISRALPGAGEEALAILEKGEVFGEMSLVDGRPRTADAVAHEGQVDLLVIEASVLSRILDIDKLSSPRLLKMLCRTVARRLRSLDDKIVGWYLISGGESTLIGGPD